MAQRVEIILIDDIDESPADEKVRFGLDGINYEIDLSSENAARLRDSLAPFVAAGRRATGRRTRASSASSGTLATEIRAWATANGYEISARGRVPTHIKAAYEAAHA